MRRRGRALERRKRADPPAVAGARREAELVIRAMTLADLPTVLEIERAAFTVPWTPATFRGLLVRPDAKLHVAVAGERVVGYTAVWIVLDQAELGDVAVADDWRGRGVGGLLLEHVLELVAAEGVRELFLEVRISNTGARRLYERYGFTEVSRRPDYYSRPREDALVLRRGMAGENS